jgi:type IV pilus biogenesis protein CpaD/CtpE
MTQLHLVALLSAIAGCASNPPDETHRISDTTATLRDTLISSDTTAAVREGPTDSVGDNR